MTGTIGTNVSHAAKLVREGGLVAFPTETVYGLGANAFDETAVAKVFAAKDRPEFDPLIVHVCDVAQLADLVTEVPPAARQLIDRFWPGPLTLVLPKTKRVPDLVTAGLPTVGVRMPDHPLALEFLREADVPVAAPSANPFGCISPTTAAHVAEQLGDKVDAILDGGPCRVGLESTVLQLAGEPEGVSPRSRAVLLRPGGVPVEDIEAVIGPVGTPGFADRVGESDSGRYAGESSNAEEPPKSRGSTHAASQPAPGMLTRHYAPHTPLEIRTPGSAEADRSCEKISDLSESRPPEQLTKSRGSSPERVGLLTFRPHPGAERFAAVETLSPSGDLVEAAAGFFAALRRLDAAGLDRIIATPFPERGLGRALNDRLRRAAAQPS